MQIFQLIFLFVLSFSFLSHGMEQRDQLFFEPCPMGKCSKNSLERFVVNDDFIGFKRYLEILAQKRNLEISFSMDNSLLCQAVSYGRLEMVKLLFEKGAMVNEPDPTGTTPLISAALNADSHEHVKVAEYLLERGAAMNKSIKGTTALWALVNREPLPYAEEKNNRTEQEMLALFLRYGADINYVHPQIDRSILGAALVHRRKALIPLLLENKDLDVNQSFYVKKNQAKVAPLQWTFLDKISSAIRETLIRHPKFSTPNDCNKFGNSYFMQAIQENNLDLAQLLLEKGALIDFENENVGDTALLIAIQNETKESIDFLLKAGANPNYQNRSLNSPLMVATSPSVFNREIFQQILSWPSINPHLKNRRGQSALHMLDKRTWREALPLLLEKKVDINDQDDKGRTLYMLAHIDGNRELIKYLEEKGADTKLRDNQNTTLLMHACTNGTNQEFIDFLVRKENVDAQNTDGATALMYAIDYANFDIARDLIEKYGADPRIKNNEGKSILDILDELSFHKERARVFYNFVVESIQQKKNDEKHGKAALIGKEFFSSIPGRALNLGAKIMALVPVKITFMEENKEILRVKVAFFHGKKDQALEFFVKPIMNHEGAISELLLVESPKTPNKTIKSAGYILDRNVTHKKNPKTGKMEIKNGISSFEGKLNLKIFSPKSAILAGKMRVQDAGKAISFDFSWQLTDKIEALEKGTENNSSSTGKTFATQKAKTEEEISAKKFYPSSSEISGLYQVLLNGVEAGEASIPATALDGEFVGDERIPQAYGSYRGIHFSMRRNDGQFKKHLLPVEMKYSVTNEFREFEPLAFDAKDKTWKFIKKRTSFDALIHIPSKTKTKRKAKGLSPLCFDTTLSLEPRLNENDDEVAFKADTSKGALRLVKIASIIEMPPHGPMNEPQEFTSDEEEDFSKIIVEGPYGNEFYEDDDLAQDAHEEINQPVVEAAPAPSRKTKRRPIIEEYVNWKDLGLGPSKEEKERIIRHDRAEREFMRKREEAQQNLEVKHPKSLSPSPKVKQKKNSDKVHEVHPTIYLSPFSNYADCDLVRDTLKESTWFGQGFVVENGHLTRIAHKKLVLGMHNWLSYPALAQNAAWGSLISSDLGDKNYYLGKNVHISYHEQLYGDKKVKYLNISHHYRFEIQQDKNTGNYLLYQIMPKSDQQIVYVLSPWDHRKSRRLETRNGSDIIAAHAREFIAWHPCWQQELEQVMDFEALQKQAKDIKQNMLMANKAIPLSKRLSFFPETMDKAKLNTSECDWNLFMINDHAGFIVIDYIDRKSIRNNKNIVFTVDSDGGISF